MRRALAAVLLLAGALAGCDEPQTIITHVDKRTTFTGNQVAVMGAGGALPVEIHGAPLEGMGPAEVIRLLKMPSGFSQATRFAAIAPGAEVQFRIVLHFNPQGGPNAFTDCQRLAPARTDTPKAEGFSVNLTFCEDDRWLAHGFMQYPKGRADEPDLVARAFEQLLMAILREEADR